MASDIVLTNPTTMAQPGGHYTHAVTANGFVFVSGQLADRAGRSEAQRGVVRAAGAADAG